jgi:hypothetical protein
MAWRRFLVSERLDGWTVSHHGIISIVFPTRADAVELAISSAEKILASADIGDRTHVILQTRDGMPEEIWYGERREDGSRTIGRSGARDGTAGTKR